MLDYYILEGSNYIFEVMTKTKEDKLNDINARRSPKNVCVGGLAWPPGGGGGWMEILPDISYIGMCHPKGNMLCAVLAWKSGMAFEKLRECMNVFIV